jgi:hypothetical protein
MTPCDYSRYPDNWAWMRDTALDLLARTRGRLEGMAMAARWVECRTPDPEYLERMAADVEKAVRLLYPCMFPEFKVADGGE